MNNPTIESGNLIAEELFPQCIRVIDKTTGESVDIEKRVNGSLVIVRNKPLEVEND